MKTELIFIDTPENGRKGVLRGIMSIALILLFSYVWYYLNDSMYSGYRNNNVLLRNKVIGIVLSVFLLSSAIAVQLPSSATNAIVYGALVGFVVYGFVNAVNLMILKNWGLDIVVIDTMWGIVSTAVISYIVYKANIY